MKAIVIVSSGLSSVAKKEIEEIASISPVVSGTALEFDVSQEKLCEIAYRMQSASRILQIISSGNFAKIEDIKLTASGIPEKECLLECVRVGTHTFTSSDAVSYAKKQLSGISFSKESACRLFLYIYEGRYFFGIDYLGFDASKRDYKIFQHPASMKGTIAYALLRMAGYEKSKVLLDPFCGSGVIPIEAALYASGKSPNFYRKQKIYCSKFCEFTDNSFSHEKIFASDSAQPSVKAAEKNATIAGVRKEMEFSRTDADWIDVKYGKDSVDIIATHPPESFEKSEKALVEFFKRAEIVLKKSGVIAIYTPHPDEIAGIAKGFKSEKHKVMEGKSEKFFLILAR